MTAAGFLGLHPDFRLGDPADNPRALKLNAKTGGTELRPVEIAPESWHRLYVEVEDRGGESHGTVWEIQRLDGGGEYRILRNSSELGTRRSEWDVARVQFCGLAWPMCPDLDEPQVRVTDLSYVVTHGQRACEVGKAVVAGEYDALAYAAGLFEMNRKGRSDDEFCRRLKT